ncbi:hypothetical protein [Corallococcus aberystwythensis]|nr:hypothetical protein [Corallococcus aberystwythensis]
MEPAHHGGGYDGGFAMGLAVIVVTGAMVAVGVIAAGGMLMFLRHLSQGRAPKGPPAP